MRRHVYLWATLVIGGLLAAACGTPRIAGNKTFDCLCNCLYCDFVDPITGECTFENTIIFGSRSCADDLGEARDACQTACNEDSLGAKACGAEVIGQVADSCLLGSPLQPLAAGRPLAVQAPDAAHAVIDPALSSAFVTFTPDGTTGDTTANGDIWIRGGDCALGSECPVEVTWLSLDMLPLSFDDHTATGVHVENNGKQPGTRLTSGAYLLAPLTASFNARGVLDGTYVSGVGQAGAPVSGELDFAGGTMTLSGTFFSEDGTILVDLILVAHFANQPPRADAGADQVAQCGAPIHLDGTGSSDPDGSIAQLSWYETAAGPQQPFATGAAPTVSLGLGAHPITLRVRDDDGALDTDETVVTVVDTAGPTITGLTVDPDCLWPANHKLVRLDLGSDIVAEVNDACTPVASVQIVGVASSEPNDGEGDGSSAPDVAFGPNAVCLRSERAGNGAARIYTITVEATDANGNTTRDDVEVSVGRPPGQAKCAPLPSSEFLEDGDPACSFPAAQAAAEPAAALAGPVAAERTASPATAGGGCAIGGGGGGLSGGGGLLLLLGGVMLLILARRRR